MSRRGAAGNEPWDIVIVGAGISGLACANMIVERTGAKGLARVLVVEANDRVGGRLLADDEATDLGGAYFGPGQDRIMRIIDQQGKKLYPVPVAGRSTLSLRGVVKHYAGTIPPAGPLAVIELNYAMNMIETMQKTVPEVDPDTAPNALALDSKTSDVLIQELCPMSVDAQNIIRTAIRVILCIDPEELSVLALLWYLRINGGTRRCFETADGLQDSKVHGGAGSIPVDLCRSVQAAGVRVQLEWPVRSIDTESSPDLIVMTGGLDGAEVLEARRVVMAIPPNQRHRITWRPTLPPQVAQAQQRYPTGHIIKTFTYYSTPWWREKKCNGISVADEGIILVTFDDTKPDGARPCIMGFVVCEQAAAWCDATPQDRCDAITKHYAKIFGDPRALQPIRYKDKCWASEEYVGGCYVGVPTLRTLTKYPRRHLMKPIGNRVFFAGTECAAVSAGYIDGGVEAGERAARNVLVSLGVLGANEYEVVSRPAPSPQMPLRDVYISSIERALPSSRVFVAAAVVVVAAAAWFAAKHFKVLQ